MRVHLLVRVLGLSRAVGAMFMDDETHFTIDYLMRTKDEALAAYKSFEAWALVQGHCTAVNVLCSNCRGKHLSDAFNAHLNTPQLNGVAERLNRTLLERICAFVHESGLPKLLSGARCYIMRSG